MKRRVAGLPTVLLVALLSGLLNGVDLAEAASAPAEMECDASTDPARITEHLAHVAATLAERDATTLPLAEQAAREAGLAALRAYIDAGVYPHNSDFPGRLAPYFIDGEGRDCAVARILRSSGGVDLAERVRREQNNAYLADMDVIGLEAWVARSGFTAEELAWIQPLYCGPESSTACSRTFCAGHPPEQPCSCSTSYTECFDDEDPCTIERCIEPSGCVSEPVDCSTGDLCSTDACVGRIDEDGIAVPECVTTTDRACELAHDQHRMAALERLHDDTPSDGCSVRPEAAGSPGPGAPLVMAAGVLALSLRRRSPRTDR